MIKTFKQYARLRENDLGMGVNPPVGNSANGQGSGETSGDVGSAFHDLSSSIAAGLVGPNGPKVLNSIINAVMGDPQVPERVKQDIRNKVSQKWSHIVDLSDSPPGQGPGLGNIPGDPPRRPPFDPSMSNIVVPNPGDNLGISQ